MKAQCLPDPPGGLTHALASHSRQWHYAIGGSDLTLCGRVRKPYDRPSYAAPLCRVCRWHARDVGRVVE